MTRGKGWLDSDAANGRGSPEQHEATRLAAIAPLGANQMAVLLGLLLELGQLSQLEGLIEVDHAGQSTRLDQCDTIGRVKLHDIQAGVFVHTDRRHETTELLPGGALPGGEYLSRAIHGSSLVCGIQS